MLVLSFHHISILLWWGGFPLCLAIKGLRAPAAAAASLQKLSSHSLGFHCDFMPHLSEQTLWALLGQSAPTTVPFFFCVFFFFPLNRWLIRAVRNRSDTEQPLCQWYTMWSNSTGTVALPLHVSRGGQQLCLYGYQHSWCWRATLCSWDRKPSDKIIRLSFQITDSTSLAALEDVKPLCFFSNASCFSHHAASKRIKDPSHGWLIIGELWQWGRVVSFIIQRVNISRYLFPKWPY